MKKMIPVILSVLLLFNSAVGATFKVTVDQIYPNGKIVVSEFSGEIAVLIPNDQDHNLKEGRSYNAAYIDSTRSKLKIFNDDGDAFVFVNETRSAEMASMQAAATDDDHSHHGMGMMHGNWWWWVIPLICMVALASVVMH